jgi:hypothetical protein
VCVHEQPVRGMLTRQRCLGLHEKFRVPAAGATMMSASPSSHSSAHHHGIVLIITRKQAHSCQITTTPAIFRLQAHRRYNSKRDITQLRHAAAQHDHHAARRLALCQHGGIGSEACEGAAFHEMHRAFKRQRQQQRARGNGSQRTHSHPLSIGHRLLQLRYCWTNFVAG